MCAPPHPYRVPAEREAAAEPERPDALGAAQRLAGYFVLGWALLRVTVCTIHGLDFEGFVAVVVLVTELATLSRSIP